ncbi:Aldo/keto reductase [Lentithecium fluviatile CBS 122367]|uniref:Aldo/keto reductase n=1 Tax=Lentithecium fluviatile CBS 122367 TaxID=1168545 RepID=A0A6G1J3Q9_9PLEO|nr:Aldo/keto reductase [Lentithecium fluviatile CBS 122367]
MASKFPQRKIGDDYVSAVGLGCMGMSIAPMLSSGRDDEEVFKTLTKAADLGITFWDTSDAYGDNEELIGKWFRETGRRDEIFLATKFGINRTNGQVEVIGTPEYVAEACLKSLERLGTDRIDLYYQHRVDTTVPIEKTVKAMAQLKVEGKIRYLGLSECSPATLRRACKVHPIAACQMEYSPFAMEVETTGFLDVARELDVKIIAYSPLGRGFLTGSIKSRADMDPKDPRLSTYPRFSEENFAGNLKLVDIFANVAKEKGCTPGQAALAWVLAQGEDFIPIPGTKRVKYLIENAEAVRVEFKEDDEKRVREGLDAVGGAKGSRYPEAFLASCFADSPDLDEA